ncbi:type II toxin-antitoxin system Phd/YefM family antitoxin [Paracidobacterium acidisoli]|uniref:Prevent-host-death protein n=1 Tax=Paracidobacterium acidisoli TaxID=2303751 RepID=A0A372ITH2_9BACT|nr:prevent-host-death protein [Paracidobacterium acidisoli]MBT9329662.1 prevent-host-death protein [Paracidobacterium acidisoli]
MTSRTQQVGVREFRENLSSYLLRAGGPIAITRHGDTIGLFMPVRRKRTAEERAELDAIAEKLYKEMENAGVTEEDIVREFNELRAASRK